MSKPSRWGTKRVPSGALVGAVHYWSVLNADLGSWRSACGLLRASDIVMPAEHVRYNPTTYGCQLCAAKVRR